MTYYQACKTHWYVCEKWWLQLLDLQQLSSPWHRLKHTVRQLPQADKVFHQYVSSCEAVEPIHHCDITDSRPREIRPPRCFAQILFRCTSSHSASFVISHVLTRARSFGYPSARKRKVVLHFCEGSGDAHVSEVPLCDHLQGKRVTGTQACMYLLKGCLRCRRPV